jgi:hypothetical protein
VSFAAITLNVASEPVIPKVIRIFHYRLSPETFGYTLVYYKECRLFITLKDSNSNPITNASRERD